MPGVASFPMSVGIITGENQRVWGWSIDGQEGGGRCMGWSPLAQEIREVRRTIRSLSSPELCLSMPGVMALFGWFFWLSVLHPGDATDLCTPAFYPNKGRNYCSNSFQKKNQPDSNILHGPKLIWRLGNSPSFVLFSMSLSTSFIAHAWRQ